MDHPRPWLRYVDADDLDNSQFSFDGLDVVSRTGEKLGDVDGFVIDANSGRPYYVAVDSGGWFKSKLFLLPVGHVGFDAEGRKLVADVGRDRVERFPGFDRDQFDKLSDAELSRMDSDMIAVCCPDDVAATSTTTTDRFDRWAHYRTPSWWNASYWRPDRIQDRSVAATSMPSRDTVRAERDRDRDREREREMVVAEAGDVSPHLGGRAQPGDVVGIETGGEQTHIGDTNEDENERRREAEKDAAKQRRS